MLFTSPILLVTDDALLTVLVFLECPRATGPLGVGGELDPAFTCPSAVLFCPALGVMAKTGRASGVLLARGG